MTTRRHPFRILTLFFSFMMSNFQFLLPKMAVVIASPEASSTLLKMHRLYLQTPPHDLHLYNTLGVSPNATLQEIQKSYRKLSRELHPDKHHHRRNGNSNNENTNNDDWAKDRLDGVRKAYEILKDDRTRLPYHRYGLVDMAQAVILLTDAGRQTGDDRDPAVRELLLLMGYGHGHHSLNHHQYHDIGNNAHYYQQQQPHSQQRTQSERVKFLAACLLERIRPLVEGTIDESTMANDIAQECDRLKNLPLGAQIVRCVGRAYRHTGAKVLRRHRWHQRRNYSPSKRAAATLPLENMGMDLTDSMRDGWRHFKHLLTAAMASGRVVVSERRSKRRQKQERERERRQQGKSINYDWDGGGDIGSLPSFLDDDGIDSDVDNDDELNIDEIERCKAHNTLLESLQLEALWKITKIELDRTVCEACDLILQGEYFFFPSHQTSHISYEEQGDMDGYYNNGYNNNHGNGWVGSSGLAIDSNVGRLRAAAALVMMGDILVQRSKDGTSWM